MKSKVFTLK